MAIFGNGWSDVKCPKNTVGTGGDLHTMTETVLLRFKGEMQPGITLRDLINAILPYGH
jgi:aconitase B